MQLEITNAERAAVARWLDSEVDSLLEYLQDNHAILEPDDWEHYRNRLNLLLKLLARDTISTPQDLQRVAFGE